jgi:hypothetical protein
VDSLLHVGVDCNHALVKIRMLPHQNLGVPCHCDKDRVDATRQRRSEDIAYLQSNQEGESDNYRRVRAIRVIRWRREEEVEVCEERACVCNEGGAHGKYWTNQAFVDESIDSAVLDHSARG